MPLWNLVFCHYTSASHKKVGCTYKLVIWFYHVLCKDCWSSCLKTWIVLQHRPL